MLGITMSDYSVDKLVPNNEGSIIDAGIGGGNNTEVSVANLSERVTLLTGSFISNG